MAGKVEDATTPPPQTRQESMVAFCVTLLQEVQAGKVRQLLAIVEAGEPQSRSPLLYLNCEEGNAEFVEDVCACVSHVVDATYGGDAASICTASMRVH